MQLTAIHRRVMMDVRVLQEAVAEILPVKMPKRYQGRAFNLSSFLARLNTVTERYGVLNVLTLESKDSGIPPHTVMLTGTWLPEDLLPQHGSSADIRVEWHVLTHTRRQRWTQKEWTKRRFYFWSYLMHEMIHRHQDVYRNNGSCARVYRPWAEKQDMQDEQTYLGDYDEIEAHAHDVALEMRIWYPDATYREALSRMKNNLLPLSFSSTYAVYLRAFRDASQHPALPVFHRKIKQWWRLMGEQDEFYQFLHLESTWL